MLGGEAAQGKGMNAGGEAAPGKGMNAGGQAALGKGKNAGGALAPCKGRGGDDDGDWQEVPSRHWALRSGDWTDPVMKYEEVVKAFASEGTDAVKGRGPGYVRAEGDFEDDAPRHGQGTCCLDCYARQGGGSEVPGRLRRASCLPYGCCARVFHSWAYKAPAKGDGSQGEVGAEGQHSGLHQVPPTVHGCRQVEGSPAKPSEGIPCLHGLAQDEGPGLLGVAG